MQPPVRQIHILRGNVTSRQKLYCDKTLVIEGHIEAHARVVVEGNLVVNNIAPGAKVYSLQGSIAAQDIANNVLLEAKQNIKCREVGPCCHLKAKGTLLVENVGANTSLTGNLRLGAGKVASQCGLRSPQGIISVAQLGPGSYAGGNKGINATQVLARCNLVSRLGMINCRSIGAHARAKAKLGINVADTCDTTAQLTVEQGLITVAGHVRVPPGTRRLGVMLRGAVPAPQVPPATSHHPMGVSRAMARTQATAPTHPTPTSTPTDIEQAMRAQGITLDQVEQYYPEEKFNSIYDPISRTLFRDPVLLGNTGHTFERASITQALVRRPNRDPLSNETITQCQLVDNYAIRDMIVNLIQTIPSSSTTAKPALKP